MDPFVLKKNLKENRFKDDIIKKAVSSSLKKTAAFFLVLGINIALSGYLIISFLAKKEIIIIKSFIFQSVVLKNVAIAFLIFSISSFFLMIYCFGISRKRYLSSIYKQENIEIKDDDPILQEKKNEEDWSKEGLKKLKEEVLDIEGLPTNIFSFISTLNISRCNQDFLAKNDPIIVGKLEELKANFQNKEFQDKIDGLLENQDRRKPKEFLTSALARAEFLNITMNEYKILYKQVLLILASKKLLKVNEELLKTKYHFSHLGNLSEKLKEITSIYLMEYRKIRDRMGGRPLGQPIKKLPFSKFKNIPICFDGNFSLKGIKKSYGKMLFCVFSNLQLEYFPIVKDVEKLFLQANSIKKIPENLKNISLKILNIFANKDICYHSLNDLIPILKSFPNLERFHVNYEKKVCIFHIQRAPLKDKEDSYIEETLSITKEDETKEKNITFYQS